MSINAKLGIFVLCVLAATEFAAPARSQANSSLRGVVTDPKGGSVPKAQVTLTNAATGLERKAITPDVGAYEFPEAPPGLYTLRVEAPGFSRYEASGIRLAVNSPTTLDIVLKLGGRAEAISVTATVPLLNTVDASIGAAVAEQQVRQLPLEARDVAALYSLQPGVVYLGNRADMDKDSDTRSGAVNGARSDQSNILLDGVDANDQTQGYAFTSVLRMTPDAVQEFRVATSNYDAAGGRSSGAQISIVTKSGSNQFHGSLYEYHRNTATSANDYFLKLNQLQLGQPNRALQLIRNVFGGSIGGPLKKDRAFFFLNYEGRRDASAESALRVVPSLTLRQGAVQYLYCGVAVGESGACPGAVQVYSLSPQTLAQMDPLHLGPNAAVMKFFQSYPEPNDSSAGDGLNYAGYRFAAPVHGRFDTFITRLDYLLTADGRHSLFWRGNLQRDRARGAPYMPGQVPLKTDVDRSAGFAAGYTAVLSPSMVNTLRWGLTRQSTGVVGNSQTPWIWFRGLTFGSANAPANFLYSHSFTAAVHNLADELAFRKGSHSITVGANIRFLRNPRSSQTNSFSSALTNPPWLATGGLANRNVPMDPPLSGFPAVLPAFAPSYDNPVMAVLGALNEGFARYNYDRRGNRLPEGAPVNRRFGADEYEFHLQDSYRILPALTVTYGLRYQLLSPPWETAGEQVAPNVDLGQWFLQRGRNMSLGIPSSADPAISYDLAGPANGKPGFYNWDYANTAPRLGIAFAPGPKSGFLHRLLGERATAIRAGFGIVYDHIGSGLLSTFDAWGSYGLASFLLSPPGALDLVTAPRLTGVNTIPPSILPPAPTGGFPQTPPPVAGTISWSLDNSIKTPYAYQLSFSLSRELRGNLTIEAAYVGHLSHRLLVQEDLAMPLNLRDPASGTDYFQAATRFSQLARASTPVSAVTPALVGPTASYWTNMFPGMAGNGLTALQAAYQVMMYNVYNETNGLFMLDYPASEGGLCENGCSRLGPNAFYNPQYGSLYAWRSIANASYHGAQLALRKRFSQGLQFDLNYSFSKSLDLASDAERIGPWGSHSGMVVNSWDYKALRAPSDFDIRSQINANWVIDLPFGRARRFGRGARGGLQALIGGWQLTGIYRWTTGLPTSVNGGYSWPTNWQMNGLAAPVGALPDAGVHRNGDGSVNLFSNAGSAIRQFRHAYPGESGARNNLRGDRKSVV